jgi:cytochrome c oxidase subunit 2
VINSRFARYILIVSGLLLGLTSIASAEADKGWWLPPDRSTHGYAIDALFTWIFWITMILFIGVELVLVVFLVKYRSRPERKKAHFTHGNPRLEMAWTIAPAIILAALALASKAAWDKYRYAPPEEGRATILVIGEQFKWNFIYPGPDGKLGRYLIYPKPGDAKWPVGADGKPVTVNYKSYVNTQGPGDMPFEDAKQAINQYIAQENPLGKDYSDPDGADDNFSNQAGRELVLPAHRQVEIQLSSKDVIHDFFLPNFRVKLDAVPGMRGHLFFTSTMSSADRVKAAAKVVPIGQLDSIVKGPGGSDYVIVIDESAPGTDNKGSDSRGWRYFNPSSPRTSIIRDGAPFGEGMIDKLKEAGLKEVKVSNDAGKWELVCEELCGQGHNTMIAQVTILDPAEYDKLKRDTPSKAGPSTAPAMAMNDAPAAR